MKIRSIKAYRMNMALKRPYTIAFETVSDVENVGVEIELSNGVVGIGVASPSIAVIQESIEDALANLQSDSLQAWVGRDIRTFKQLIDESRAIFPKHSATRAALDIALHDAFGKYLGIPVVDFFGRKHSSLPTSVTIGIMSTADTLTEAKEYKSLGFKTLKVKTGINLEQDIERCVALREAFGGYFKIRVDANQGYTDTQTVAFVEATQHLGLELIEQPMPVGTEAQMRALPAAIKRLVACDESLKNADSALRLLDTCGIFNIKLMKCGGIAGAFEIATVAKAAGIELFWGCFDESIASITAALHAAMACPHTRYLDLDGSLDLAKDIVMGGFILQDGEMRIGNEAGFGCRKI